MIRRSLGTRTMTGLNDWLYRTFVKGRSVDADLTAYRSGTPLRVYCSTPDLGTPRTILGTSDMALANKPGYLHLTLGRPVEWHAISAGETVPVTAIGPLTTAGDMYPGSPRLSAMIKRIGVFHVETPQGMKHLNIPRIDAALVAEALRTPIAS